MQVGRGLPNWALGAILVAIIACASFLAYTKRLPWADRYEVSAVFENSQYLRPSNPVRIAGVNVGKVTEIEQVSVDDDEAGEVPSAQAPAQGGATAARVTMEIDESALPLREDATFKIRPRLFLEGNYFIDVTVGSPGAPAVDEGHSFGLEQTSYSVQLDQILTTFQADVRSHLKTVLDQFGNSLIDHGGAKGLNDLFRAAPVAYRYTAQVNEAMLGTRPHDLSGMIDGLGRVLRGLGRDEQALGSLVTNLRTVTGAFAAEDRALGRAVELLPDFLEAGEPAFQSLNRALPPLRAFAIEALPGTLEAPETLRTARPMLTQLRKLMSPAELRGLVARLRPTVPDLAALAEGNTRFFEQTRALSSCFNEVVIPWSHSTVEPVGSYPLPIGGRVFENTAYAITGAGSESRSGDANGQHLRVVAGSGTNIVRMPFETGDLFSLVPFEILGAIPRLRDSLKTEYRPDVACETQEQPNLQAGIDQLPPGSQQPLAQSAMGLDALSGPGADRLRALASDLGGLEDLAGMLTGGERREARSEIDRLQRAVDRLGLQEINVTEIVEGLR